jgi:hypothetical protein
VGGKLVCTQAAFMYSLKVKFRDVWMKMKHHFQVSSRGCFNSAQVDCHVFSFYVFDLTTHGEMG